VGRTLLSAAFDFQPTNKRATGAAMKFAAIWGVLTLAPLYFIFNLIGQKDPPHHPPGFFYGFVGAALAWQLAFVIIANDPARYRPLMIPSVFEKFSYGIAVVILIAQGRMHSSDLLFGGVDLLLGTLFVIAYLKTPRRESPRTT
jgi:hypothetical protein